jgi:hypothetical protein
LDLRVEFVGAFSRAAVGVETLLHVRERVQQFRPEDGIESTRPLFRHGVDWGGSTARRGPPC